MLSDKILRFTFCEKLEPYFALYFTQSKLYRQQIEHLASGNQNGMRNVSQKNLRLVELPLPTILEQQEITRLLNAILSKESQILIAAQASLAQIGLTKKTILARAFRGGLGTNAPAEQSAASLLEFCK